MPRRHTGSPQGPPSTWPSRSGHLSPWHATARFPRLLLGDFNFPWVICTGSYVLPVLLGLELTQRFVDADSGMAVAADQ